MNEFIITIEYKKKVVKVSISDTEATPEALELVFKHMVRSIRDALKM